MPRIAKELTKRELDTLRRKVKGDSKFQAMRADGGQAGLCVRVRGVGATWKGSGRGGRLWRHRCEGIERIGTEIRAGWHVSWRGQF